MCTCNKYIISSKFLAIKTRYTLNLFFMIQNFELCILSNAYLHKNKSIIAWYLYRRTLTWLKGGGPYLVSKSPLARALIDQHTARRSTQVLVHNSRELTTQWQ